MQCVQLRPFYGLVVCAVLPFCLVVSQYQQYYSVSLDFHSEKKKLFDDVNRQDDDDGEDDREGIV